MFLKIIAIRLIPLLTIIFGSLLVIRTLWSVLSSRKIEWKEFKPLDLDDLDVLLEELNVFPPVLLLEPQLANTLVRTTRDKSQTTFLFRL